MKDEWEIKWNQKTMRSQKFLCDRSFGFSSFLLTDANLSFFFFSSSHLGSNYAFKG